MKKILPGISKLLQAGLMISLCILSACHSGGDADDKNTGSASPKKPSDTIAISPKQMEIAGITTGSIEQKDLSSIIKATGALVLPPSNQAMVSTAIAGNVKQILVKEGDDVKSGQIVAYIESPEFNRMQQDYLTTKSDLVYIEQEYERQKLLNDQNAGTGKVFQQAKANFLSGQEKLKTMAAALKQLHISLEQLNQGNVSAKVPLIAPLSGQVNHVYVTIGSPAEVNKPLLDLINNQGIYADLKIFEKDINQVKVGQKVELALNGQPQQFINGVIYALNSTFETDNRVVIAHVRLIAGQTSHLIPGTYVSATIKTSNQTTTALPMDAVVSDGAKQFIFLALGEGDERLASDHGKKFNFKKIEIITGQTDMGYIAIKPLLDLPKNVKVVTKGARYILAESLKGDSDGSSDTD
jgi:cobalt-zinc-cadmium efflux system membrane fusion protein